ncbi:MAG TPA: 3'-5' exonuclease [Ramlibacter sp.]|uniref:3'-5' exonuclease n=1 Tax=Ramlibacter sp. TaxID=1917967 RepID=UPI002D7E2590|nr:3'-5' exonuclease [Ramlibacter sp.]HET8744595.1 3'-5' exonuclease [Ramlibacter sp.]
MVTLWPRRGAAVDETRWLVVDVETSGLDAARDRLLAIAAIAVHVDWPARRLALHVADSFEIVVRQEVRSPRANILLHGIGVQRQQQGVPVAEALRAFAQFAGASPLLAFHAAFDRALIGRHARAALGAPLANRWLDIEHLCGVTHPELRARSLDEWLGRFHIQCAARHQAICDTLAECELLLRIWPRVAAECASWRDVERLAARHRWVQRA